MKRKNFLWNDRDDRAITEAADALGTSVTQFILMACHEKIKRGEDAQALADIRQLVEDLSQQSEGRAVSLSQLLSQNASDEMRKFKLALATELDEHLRIIVDTLTRYGKTGTVPKPKGSGIDINNM